MEVADVAGKNVSHFYREAKAFAFQQRGTKAVDNDGNLMLDDDGNQMYVDNSPRLSNLWNRMRGRKTFKSYSTDANGNISETKTTLKGDYKVGDDGKVQMVTGGSKRVTQRDDFGYLEKVQNANSSAINAKVDIGRRKFLQRDGSINQHNLDMFMQNSTFSDEEKNVALVQQLVKERMAEYAGGKLEDDYKKRTVRTVKVKFGNNIIIVEQINKKGTLSTFEAKFGKNGRVMTTIGTTDGKGNKIEYATDGIIQRKVVTKDGKTNYTYAVSNVYAGVGRPVYTDGTLNSNIDENNVLFEKEDLVRFGQQVLYHGNRAYQLGEFN